MARERTGGGGAASLVLQRPRVELLALIDVEEHSFRRFALPPLEFNYAPGPLHVVDNGHTIQVNVDPGSSLTVAGQRYELVQFHFHHPSEHGWSSNALRAGDVERGNSEP
jgi:hypothetical protein